MGFSLAVVSGGYSLVVGLLIVVAPLAAEHGIRAHKLHELQHVGSVAVAPGPWSTGSIVVVRGLSYSTACGSLPESGIEPCVSCTGRRILFH